MHKHTVLAVDDEPGPLALYRKLFPSESDDHFDIFGKTPADSAPPAIECRTYSEPALLLAEYSREVDWGVRHPVCIVDMQMLLGGNLDKEAGFKVAAELRRIDPDINIVFSTAVSHILPEEVREKLNERVFFVLKPFDNEEFTLLIQSLVDYWQSRQELIREKAFLTRLLESVSDLVFMKDAAGIYISCNEAFCRFLDRSRDRVIGLTDHDLFPRERAELFRESDRFAMTGKEIWKGDEWLMFPDGSRRLLRTTKSPVLSGKGECIGIVGVVRDATPGAVSEIP